MLSTTASTKATKSNKRMRQKTAHLGRCSLVCSFICCGRPSRGARRYRTRAALALFELELVGALWRSSATEKRKNQGKRERDKCNTSKRSRKVKCRRTGNAVSNHSALIKVYLGISLLYSSRRGGGEGDRLAGERGRPDSSRCPERTGLGERRRRSSRYLSGLRPR